MSSKKPVLAAPVPQGGIENGDLLYSLGHVSAASPAGHLLRQSGLLIMTCQTSTCNASLQHQEALLKPSTRRVRPFQAPGSSACILYPRPSYCSPVKKALTSSASALAARGRVLVMAQSMTVTVTGAGGRTGKLIMQKLLAQPDKFTARGVVRDEKGKQKLQAEGVPAEQIYAGDIVESREVLGKALQGADALVIATSGVPQIKPLSLIGVFWKKLLRQEGARPDFTFKKGQYPEQVDWLGQKAQIDAAKEAGVKKVVLISSMGGTDENNPLNKLGNGNILIWKRKAEEYLIDSKAFTYTIIHPGGLIDEEGGVRELVLEVDDELLERPKRSIPRADVAELAVQSLIVFGAENRSIDAISKEPSDGKPTRDFAALFDDLAGNCKYGPGSVKPAANR